MLTHKTYQFRLDPTEDQLTVLHQHGGNIRFVWNKLLDFANKQKEINKKYPNQSELQKKIIEIKNENDFLKQNHSQPVQINATRIVEAFRKAFSETVVSERNQRIRDAKKIQDPFERKKALDKAFKFGFPKFKSKKKNHDSIFYPQNFKIYKSKIFLAKIGWIKCIFHREIEGNPKFVTVCQEGDKYNISITSEVEIIIPEKVPLDKANIIGIDVGLKKFATFSDGTEIENPRTLKKHLKRVKRENKRLSRKSFIPTGQVVFGKEISKSSKNREKQRAKLFKIHKKIRNIRKNFLHNLTHDMTIKYDGFIMETLDIEEMLKEKSKAMNRSILDASWYEFGQMLLYKSAWRGKYFCKVDQFFASTQLCSVCGGMMSLSLKDREYVCKHCGAVLGRDYNSSINLYTEGMSMLRKMYTVATTGIYACGLSSKEERTKQEKLEQQRPLVAFA